MRKKKRHVNCNSYVITNIIIITSSGPSVIVGIQICGTMVYVSSDPTQETRKLNLAAGSPVRQFPQSHK